jgi:coenzyme F420 hydrogenase subunit delta
MGWYIDMIEELFNTPIVVFGCGNVLFGDDGFGPEVIAWLTRNHALPPAVFAVDVGTGIGNYLFDLSISPTRPRCIFIVDAISQSGREPGELFELSIEQMPAAKSGDFSLHQFPSVNLLQEMQAQGGVRVRILAAQIKQIPEVVEPGLSIELQQAVPRACDWLLQAVTAELATLPQT